ncbi:MAG: FtsQ-type POTRA domain-containing protein [Coriobacteriales bacterium]|nr:FtsQ-type POTRA domain-containing protein [Coriobacteriales bacterium]
MASNSDRRSSSSGSDRRGGSDTRRNATNRQQGGQTSRTPASRQGNRGSGQQQSASQRAGAFSRSLDPTIRSQFSMYGQNSSSFSQRRGTATWAERTARLSERTEREPQSRSVREPQSRTDRQVIDFESRLRARQQSRNQQSRLEIRNSFDAQVAREERYRRDREAAQRASTAPDSSRSVRPGAMHPSVRAARSMQLREQERVLSTSTRTQPLSPASSRYVSSHQQARSTQETRSLMGGRAGTSATQRIHENIRQRMGDGRSIRDIEAQKHRLELRKTILGIAARVAVVLLILGALVGGGVALYNSSLFSIEEVSVSGNRYMSSSEVMGLAAVPDDATMLRIDTKEIERRLETSPWIEKASVSRSLPHGLRIEVTERQISLCVKMPIDTNTGVVRYWALSADGIWLASMDQDEMDAVNNQIEVQE